MNKLALLVVAGGCLLPLGSRALDLKQAKLTQVVNKVDIISPSEQTLHQAAINDDFKMPEVLRTGPDSRGGAGGVGQNHHPRRCEHGLFL